MKAWSKFAFFIVAILWGSSFAFQKPLLDYINPYTFTFWNFFISGVLLLVMALYRRTSLTYRVKEGILLGLLLASTEIFQMVGLRLTSAADTAFISNVGMLLIPYAGWLIMRHKVSRANNIALAVAVVGMYMLVGGISNIGWGHLALIVSSASMALYFLYSERFESERNSHLLPLLMQQFFTTSAACALVVLFFGDSFAVPSNLTGPFLWQIILFTTLPYMLIQWASKWADEMIAAIYDGVVEPLVGGLVAWVWFTEPATKENVAGGIIMVIAFSFASIFSNRHFLQRGIKAIRNFVR